MTTSIRIYNTLTKTKETLQTVEPGKVGMYLCGPTVYAEAHIGHMVGPVIFDTIKRYLQYSGYEVTWVVNITDVDDKLINKSREKGISMFQLATQMTADYLRKRLQGSKRAIKNALLDQSLIAGVGNIYASESLFRAGIDPRTAAGKLSLKRLARLVPAIKATLAAAIDAGGSSLRDFIHSDGSSGYFQQQYFVYGRSGAPCHVCGRPIRELRQGQRATFFCATCQR